MAHHDLLVESEITATSAFTVGSNQPAMPPLATLFVITLPVLLILFIALILRHWRRKANILPDI